MNNEIATGGYERPEVSLVGSIFEHTLQNYPASGQDDASFLNLEGFGS